MEQWGWISDCLSYFICALPTGMNFMTTYNMPSVFPQCVCALVLGSKLCKDSDTNTRPSACDEVFVNRLVWSLECHS